MAAPAEHLLTPKHPMWCGNEKKHDAHDWGRWLQHHCRGKGNFSWFRPRD
jgi:hypothetical protein